MRNSKRSESASILFIGNSFTQRNNLPKLIADMAAERAITVKHELISAGGASLRTHWNAGRAAARIRTGKFDFVVLQEQSTLPVKNATRMAENIQLFDDVITKAGSKLVLYMTWPREHSPDHQLLIENAYKSIANKLSALLVPAGVAWNKFRTKHSLPNLYDADQSHPSPAGSYLVACVFLATLLDASPMGLKYIPDGLEQSEAQTIQRFVGNEFRRARKDRRLDRLKQR
jgi:hypothetical protein